MKVFAFTGENDEAHTIEFEYEDFTLVLQQNSKEDWYVAISHPDHENGDLDTAAYPNPLDALHVAMVKTRVKGIYLIGDVA